MRDSCERRMGKNQRRGSSPRRDTHARTRITKKRIARRGCCSVFLFIDEPACTVCVRERDPRVVILCPDAIASNQRRVSARKRLTYDTRLVTNFNRNSMRIFSGLRPADTHRVHFNHLSVKL